MKFRNKPTEIDAVPVRDLINAAQDDWDSVPAWAHDAFKAGAFVFFRNGIVVGDSDRFVDNGLDVQTVGPDGWLTRTTSGGLALIEGPEFEATYFPCSPAGIAGVVAALLAVAEQAGKGFAQEVTHRLRATGAGR